MVELLVRYYRNEVSRKRTDADPSPWEIELETKLSNPEGIDEPELNESSAAKVSRALRPYEDATDDPFYLPGYGNFPKEIARLAKKLFRARDDMAMSEDTDTSLETEIDEALRHAGYTQWKKLEPRVDTWYNSRH